MRQPAAEPSLNELEAKELLDRCERHCRSLQRQRLVALAVRRSLPIAIAALTILLVVRLLDLWLWPALVITGAALLIVAIRTLRQATDWRVPLWKVVAYVDRHSGARGTLVAKLDGHNFEIPAAAHAVRLERPSNGHTKSAALAMVALFAAATFIPLPSARHGAAPTPVLRTRTLVDELAAQSDERFWEEAQEALDKLAQSDVLDAEDFEALERIEREATTQLHASSTSMRKQSEALEELESLLQRAERGEEVGDQLAALTQRIAKMNASGQTQKLAELAQAMLNPNANTGTSAGSGKQTSAQANATQSGKQTSAQANATQSGKRAPAANATQSGKRTSAANATQSGKQASAANATQSGKRASAQGNTTQSGKRASAANAAPSGAQSGQANAGTPGGAHANAGALSNLRQQVAQQRQTLDQQHAANQKTLAEGGAGGIGRGRSDAALTFEKREVRGSHSQAIALEMQDDPEAHIITGLSAASEHSVRDRATKRKGRFEHGSDSPYWHKRMLPKHRQVVRDYFKGR